jgi:three-Cys-motif partner protein
MAEFGETISKPTIEKWNHLNDYLNAYTTVVSSYFPRFYYIDAFAGRGKYGGHLGSPLLALNLKFPFTDYIFVEVDKKKIEELEKNVTEFSNRQASIFRKYTTKSIPISIEYKNIDANCYIQKCLANLPNVPCFIFLDPEGIELEKRTVEICSKKSKVELMINFSIQGVVRNIPNQKAYSTLTKFYGSDSWKTIQSSPVNRGELFAESYISGIKKYFKCPPLYKVVKTSKKVPIYYLIFVTNVEAGHNIMRDVMGLKEKQLKLGNNFKTIPYK